MTQGLGEALTIGDPCPQCGRELGSSQGHVRCSNCGWLGRDLRLQAAHDRYPHSPTPAASQPGVADELERELEEAMSQRNCPGDPDHRRRI